MTNFLPKKIETGSLEFNVFLCYTGDSLKQCDANDQNALNTCLFQIVEDLRPFMPTGDQPIFNHFPLNRYLIGGNSIIKPTHFHWRTLEIGGADVQFLFSIELESESWLSKTLTMHHYTQNSSLSYILGFSQISPQLSPSALDTFESLRCHFDWILFIAKLGIPEINVPVLVR